MNKIERKKKMPIPKISRVMSTQHPDNVTTPFFAKESVIAGDDEIKEAFYAYSHLGVDEQLWDTEGKEVDTHVVEKLFTRYPEYLQKNILGKDKILSLRVPNPDVEKAQAKILLETLNAIGRKFDLAKRFYGKDIPPVFEVMLPMCSDEKNLIRIHRYYTDHIIKAQQGSIVENDISLQEWLGKFGPSDIRVTPLFETKEAILNSANYVEKYMQSENIKEFQRVWFARSDPAMNYSSAAAVLMLKVGLQRLHALEKKSGVKILPIIGCGTTPFRGNLRPNNVDAMLKAYPSVQTFTVQSAFKYDYPVTEVIKGVKKINDTPRKDPIEIDEDIALPLIDKMEKKYMESVKQIAPIINTMSKYIPKRRKRKLHIGLFGYSRNSKGVSLPRAITFCATLYSLGLPPEVLGLSALNEKELNQVRNIYKSIDSDMSDALSFLNKDALSYFPKEIEEEVLKIASLFPHKTNEKHKKYTSEIVAGLKKGDEQAISEAVVKAAQERRFLG